MNKNKEWDIVNLADANAIKGLLRFRWRFDLLLDDYDRHSMSSNCDLIHMLDDMICIYSDLDKLIKDANFSEYQIKILNMYMWDFTEEDIAKSLNVEQQTINRAIDNMCEVLCRLNYQNWKLDYAYWSLVKVNTNFKQCTKCNEWLPATEEYFSPHEKGQYYLHPYCKKCRNI